MIYVKVSSIIVLVYLSILYTSCNSFSVVFAQNAEYIFVETLSDSKSKMLGVNDSFTISGSLISTIDPTSLYASQIDDFEQLNSSEDFNTEFDNLTNTQGLSNSTNELQRKNVNLSTDDEMINQTDTLSNNLVSMLSGIIIQSIERGNPTINNNIINDSSDSKNKNVSTLISGNWIMNVNSANVTNFDSTFVMISANATGFHWNSINNFKGNGSLFFGNDDTIIFKGFVDFITDNKLTVENSNVIFAFINFELIQIIFLDNKIANHFQGFPLYGIIDSIEIKN